MSGAPSPPAPATPLDYYDALHAILLNHIHRGNTAAVLATLAIPHVYSNPLFWETCTYREGLVAAVIAAHIEGGMGETQQVMDATQPLACPDEAVVIMSDVSASIDTSTTADTTSAAAGPLTLPELYLMLRGCVAAAPRQQAATRKDGGEAANPMDASQLLPSQCAEEDVNSGWRAPGPTGDRGRPRASAALQQLLAQMEQPPPLGSASHDHNYDHNAEVILGCGDADGGDDSPSAMTTSPAVPNGCDQQDDRRLVDLASLSTLLQAHCHSMRYVNPLQQQQHTQHMLLRPDREGGATASPTPPVLSANSADSAVTDPMLFADPLVSRKRDREDSSDEACLTAVKDLVIGQGQGGAADDDALVVLSSVTPLPGTQRVADNFDSVLPSQVPNDNEEDEEHAVPAVHAQPRPIILQKDPRVAVAQNNNNNNNEIVVQQQQQQPSRHAPIGTEPAAAEDRVAHAIQAFDAFLDAHSHPAEPHAGTGGGAHTAAAAAARGGGVAAKKRRKKFTVEEDAAIMHGIGRFGGHGSGRFDYIFKAYQSVWQPGRKPIQLYDHWRDALRRRAVLDPEVTAAMERLPQHRDAVDGVGGGAAPHRNGTSAHGGHHEVADRWSALEGLTAAARRAQPLPTGLRRAAEQPAESPHISDYED